MRAVLMAEIPADEITIIATGPLTSEALTKEIMKLTGDDQPGGMGNRPVHGHGFNLHPHQEGRHDAHGDAANAEADEGPHGEQGALEVMAAVVGVLAAGWLLAVSRRPLEALIVVAGPLAVLVSYVYLAHSLDPCVLGLWQQGSSTGGVPLCETFGSGIGIHTRFHLLLHSLAGIPGLILFAVGLRRSAFARRPVDLTRP